MSPLGLINYCCSTVHGSVYVAQLCVLQVNVETNWNVSNIPTFPIALPADIQTRAFYKGPQSFPTDPYGSYKILNYTPKYYIVVIIN